MYTVPYVAETRAMHGIESRILYRMNYFIEARILSPPCISRGPGVYVGLDACRRYVGRYIIQRA